MAILGVQEPTPVGKLKMRSVPALSAAMPMWDCLQLFKIGRAHMAVLCEATERAPPASGHLCRDLHSLRLAQPEKQSTLRECVANIRLALPEIVLGRVML